MSYIRGYVHVSWPKLRRGAQSVALGLALGMVVPFILSATPVHALEMTPAPAVGESCANKGGDQGDGDATHCWTAETAMTLTVRAGGDGVKYSYTKNGTKHEIKKNELGFIELNAGQSLYVRAPVFTWDTHRLKIEAIQEASAPCTAREGLPRPGFGFRPREGTDAVGEKRVIASCSDLPPGLEARGVLDRELMLDEHTEWFSTLNTEYESNLGDQVRSVRMQYRFVDR